jgi:hypothetical protein
MQRLVKVEEGTVAASQPSSVTKPRKRQAKRKWVVEEDEGAMTKTDGQKKRKPTEKASS